MSHAQAHRGHRLVRYRNTIVTETVYREQIRLVLMQGAETMDDLFS
jgi:hypothetical protein